MEYTYDIYEHRWYNLETFEYCDNDFDSRDNQKRLKIISIYPKFGSKYTYRDMEDIRLVFNNGDIFGHITLKSGSSSFNIPIKSIVNPKILNKHCDELEYLIDYIKMCREIAVDHSYSLASNDDVLKEVDNGIRKKLTKTQKLYIELNRSAMEQAGVGDFKTE